MCDRGGEFDDEDEEDSSWKHVSVAFMKDDVAGIFARSSRGEKEFQDFTVNQRTAVGLARYLQDPLVEFAGKEWNKTIKRGNYLLSVLWLWRMIMPKERYSSLPPLPPPNSVCI